ncbi:DUF5990 family protein [Hymenobacter jeollabukensis]|uniref:Uncharacterized protein n=1 Tax=Hymenobacter jeollabukensis TaxID=2025313 RepID=A0A5R8WIN4_9BACT|nr:DUF5990 family protein [Hymenobacter jeollabukensis]TLM88728.1 hypothetical protein FDY95_23115 [Hymenobacter jeollabukensis]
MKPLLRFQLHVVNAPAGVTVALQQGTTQLLPPVVTTSEGVLLFETELGVSQVKDQQGFRLSGPCVHGRGDDRFLYLNSGTLAGQADSCWTRRAKVPLPVLTAALVEQALAAPSAAFQARMWGWAADGGPACASIRLLEAGWRLVSAAPTGSGNG